LCLPVEFKTHEELSSHLTKLFFECTPRSLVLRAGDEIKTWKLEIPLHGFAWGLRRRRGRIFEKLELSRQFDDGFHSVDESLGRRVVWITGQLNPSGVATIPTDRNPMNLSRLPAFRRLGVDPEIRGLVHHGNLLEQFLDGRARLGREQHEQ